MNNKNYDYRAWWKAWRNNLGEKHGNTESERQDVTESCKL